MWNQQKTLSRNNNLETEREIFDYVPIFMESLEHIKGLKIVGQIQGEATQTRYHQQLVSEFTLIPRNLLDLEFFFNALFGLCFQVCYRMS